MIDQPRIPLPAITRLIGKRRKIQVNHCRMPDCENYGISARPEHSKLAHQ